MKWNVGHEWRLFMRIFLQKKKRAVGEWIEITTTKLNIRTKVEKQVHVIDKRLFSFFVCLW